MNQLDLSKIEDNQIPEEGSGSLAEDRDLTNNLEQTPEQPASKRVSKS